MDEMVQIPLTVTTLELLCGSGFKPTPQHQRYILEALHSIPRLVKRVALNESEPNGDLAFGWVLRNGGELNSNHRFRCLRTHQILSHKTIDQSAKKSRPTLRFTPTERFTATNKHQVL